jgi:hypothetical protein
VPRAPLSAPGTSAPPPAAAPAFYRWLAQGMPADQLYSGARGALFFDGGGHGGSGSPRLGTLLRSQHHLARGRRLDADHLRMGICCHGRRVRGGRHQRSPYQSGGHSGPGGPAAVPLEQGPALLGRPGGPRVPRSGPCVLGLQQRHRGGQRRAQVDAQAGQRSARVTTPASRRCISLLSK